ncbi:MAG: AMP-binding protein, partial [Actinobacteria bacterium]|nr:AMP-binding protein [Actinomycetota bacterium]
MTAHDKLQTEKLTDRGRAGDAIVRRATPVLEGQRDDVSVPESPIVQSRPNSMTPSATYEFDVPQDVTRRVADLRNLWGASLLELTVAAFKIVLARYTGQDDIAVITPAPGRSYPVVLRSRVTDSTSFLEFAAEVRATVGAAFTNSDVPFERLVEELGLGSELARAAVVCEPGAAPLAADITVRLVEQGNELSGAVDYRLEKFDGATIERMAAHLVRVLNVVTADPSIAVRQIDLLADDERRRMLVEWNDTEQVVPSVVLPELLHAQVARTPEATAVVFEGVELSYAELNGRANRLAWLLMERGVGPERFVALALPRSVEMVVALLAVLKAGGAYVPVDPELPAERIGFMLADARPVLVVTTSAVAARLPAVAGVDQLVLDQAGIVAALGGCRDVNPTDGDRARPLSPVNPAYVIYTSGSTGWPKGVVVSHAGLASFSAAEVERYAVAVGDRVLQFSSPSFDASVLELCMSLPTGAALVVPPPGPLLGEQLAQVLAEHQVTHALI